MRPVAIIIVTLSIALFSRAVLAQDLAKAKQEGRVVFYTSWGPSDADYVVKAFEKKYAPLKVEVVRASSERTLTRLLSEHRANKFLGDVVAVSGIQSGILKEKAHLIDINPARRRIFPPIGATRTVLAWDCIKRSTSSAITLNSCLPMPSPKTIRTCSTLVGKASSVGIGKSIICLAP
ncbi:MAG TPA: hypothetical protein VGW77_06575 [Candidatus Binatia bacterium]|jgi:hypothetical protein|nr:hypothetical protein [Candidatus Binatia bacterium]